MVDWAWTLRLEPPGPVHSASQLVGAAPSRFAETSGEAAAGTADGILRERLRMQAMAVEEQPSPLRPLVR